MDKKQHTQFWRDLAKVSPVIFVLIAIACGIIAVGALRANNLKMVELRQAVFSADQRGDNVEVSLKALREHVYNHMNTSLVSGPNAVRPPIQLKYTYDRLVRAQQIKAEAEKSAASASNATIYSSAQKYCEAKIPNGVSGRYRLDCIQQFVKEHPANTAAVVGPGSIDIPKNLYQFDFVSPRWSPDLAGWSLLAAVASLLAAISIWLRHIVRHLLQAKHHPEEQKLTPTPMPTKTVSPKVTKATANVKAKATAIKAKSQQIIKKK